MWTLELSIISKILSFNSRNCRKKQITEIIILQEGELELELFKKIGSELEEERTEFMAICDSLTQVRRERKEKHTSESMEVSITLTGIAGMNLSKADWGHSS